MKKKVTAKKTEVKRPRGFREEDKLRYITVDEALQMTNQQHQKILCRQAELVKELEIRYVQEQVKTLNEKLNRLAFEKTNCQKKTRTAQETIDKFNTKFSEDYEIARHTHTWGWNPNNLELIVTPKD